MTSTLLTPLTFSTSEQRVLLSGVSWHQYELLLATLGDDFPNLRLSYLEGLLEIMTTSLEHEELKTLLGMLIEAYFQEKRIRFHGIGSATFRRASKQRGVEPDECYCLGGKKELPDIAVEVVLSSGLVDKLEIYQGLGIPEVWEWRDSQFRLHCLGENGYEMGSKSRLLPDLDFDVLAEFVRFEDQYDALMGFRERIRE